MIEVSGTEHAVPLWLILLGAGLFCFLMSIGFHIVFGKYLPKKRRPVITSELNEPPALPHRALDIVNRDTVRFRPSPKDSDE